MALCLSAAGLFYADVAARHAIRVTRALVEKEPIRARSKGFVEGGEHQGPKITSGPKNRPSPEGGFTFRMRRSIRPKHAGRSSKAAVSPVLLTIPCDYEGPVYERPGPGPLPLRGKVLPDGVRSPCGSDGNPAAPALAKLIYAGCYKYVSCPRNQEPPAGGCYSAWVLSFPITSSVGRNSYSNFSPS